MTPWGIHWANPDVDDESFTLSIVGPDVGGWYSALIELGNENEELLDEAKRIIIENNYYRPHDNWDWETINTTYMKKVSTYHQIKLRKENVKHDEEE